MKSVKEKILQKVFRKSNSSTQTADCSTSQHPRVEPTTATMEHGETASNEERVGSLATAFPESKTEIFNEPFSASIEKLYVRDKATIRRRKICGGEIERDIFIGTNGTSFLDLPREVRNEIYYYAVASPDKLWNIRKPRARKQHQDRYIMERLPQLCRAIPLYTEEVLEMHYVCNTHRFASYYGEGPARLLNWIHRRGVEIVKNIRHVQIVHHLDNYLYSHYPSGNVTTTITQQQNCTLEVTCNQQRTQDDCHCSIAELIQERLLREDAQEDLDCVHRIETSTEYGPVLGFTLQLLEAVQLALKRASLYKNLTWAERRSLHEKLPKQCVMCNKRKRAFHV